MRRGPTHFRQEGIVRFRHFVVMASLAWNIPVAAAQDSAAETCRPALMKDIVTIMSSDQQKYSYFSQIDEKVYQQLKIDASAGVSIPLLGDMLDVLKASADYSQFSEKRREYFQRIGYTQDTARETKDIRIVTSPIAYTAWSQCVLALASSKKSLTIFKSQEDKDTVHVIIRNSSPVSVKLTSDLLGGSVSGQAEGKAFKNGTKLGAAGEKPVLIRRSGASALKLSIESTPPFEGLFVASEWGNPPAPALAGSLTTNFEESRVEERGTKRSDPKDTPELHEVRCRYQPCSGVWQLAHDSISLTATAGRKLKNPRIVCHQDNRRACSWANEPGNARCVLGQNDTVAQCSYTTGSRKHSIALLADEYEIVTNPAPSKQEAVLLFSGGDFLLRVPTRAKSAHFDYKTATGTSGFTPGDASSPDGKIVLLGHEDKPDASYFTYRFQ